MAAALTNPLAGVSRRSAKTEQAFAGGSDGRYATQKQVKSGRLIESATRYSKADAAEYRAIGGRMSPANWRREKMVWQGGGSRWRSLGGDHPLLMLFQTLKTPAFCLLHPVYVYIFFASKIKNIATPDNTVLVVKPPQVTQFWLFEAYR